MSLREKIVNKLNENLTIDIEGRCSIGAYDLVKVADQILALIEGQRCEWAKQADGGFLTSCRGYWLPGCWITDYPTDKCPCCGRKIEVKDEG